MQTLKLIGIIVEKKNINFIKETLINRVNEETIFLSNENISNLKNVKFETIVVIDQINKIINDLDVVKNIIKNAETIIINSDIKENIKLIQNLKVNAITFGFGTKATITTSSITDEEIMVCIQRKIKNYKNNIIEPQEISVNIEKNELKENASNAMAIVGLKLLYNCL